MSSFSRRLSLVFAAGCLGGLVNSFAVWYAGYAGIPHRFGVALAPALNLAWLYPRIVWGGLWGLVFLLPCLKGGFFKGVILRGVLLSLAPTLFQLLYVFPEMLHKGFFGTGLGGLTPVFVVLYNIVWGITAALWLYHVNRGS